MRKDVEEGQKRKMKGKKLQMKEGRDQEKKKRRESSPHSVI